MLPDWVVYAFAVFGALSLVLQVVAGIVHAVRRARVAAAWKRQRNSGVWP